METEITFTREQAIELYNILDNDQTLAFLYRVLSELQTDRHAVGEFEFTKQLIKRRQLEILDDYNPTV